jgi:hypothetical protein
MDAAGKVKNGPEELAETEAFPAPFEPGFSSFQRDVRCLKCESKDMKLLRNESAIVQEYRFEFITQSEIEEIGREAKDTTDEVASLTSELAFSTVSLT